MSEKYASIIDLPHHQSEKRTHMSMYDRAAQFAPFAALTGYGEAVDETARLTENQIELDEDYILGINEELNFICNHIKENPEVKVTYFIPDDKKEGGRYVTVRDKVKKIDTINCEVLLSNGVKIRTEDIYKIEMKRKN